MTQHSQSHDDSALAGGKGGIASLRKVDRESAPPVRDRHDEVPLLERGLGKDSSPLPSAGGRP